MLVTVNFEITGRAPWVGWMPMPGFVPLCYATYLARHRRCFPHGHIQTLRFVQTVWGLGVAE
jgi:hypothetical protein